MINDANMLESVELAKCIQKNVCKTAGRINKGVKQDAFLVLRETSMPACLIELGYITTAIDENYLNSKNGIDALARGIYQAFAEYKSKRMGEDVATPPQRHEQGNTEKPTVNRDSTKKQEENKKYEERKDNTPKLEKQDDTSAQEDAKLLFKVQFLTSEKKMSAEDKRLKGLKNVDCYKDGGIWKYTVGSSSDYNEINKLRRETATLFPQAFIVAFKNGERMDLQTAIKEAKKK